MTVCTSSKVDCVQLWECAQSVVVGEARLMITGLKFMRLNKPACVCVVNSCWSLLFEVFSLTSCHK